jgi:hypothetical protein
VLAARDRRALSTPEYAKSDPGANPNPLTGEAMVQFEYADYLKTRD